MNTKERLGIAMAELMRRQGYAATGIKQVAQAAEVPIGSVYHHYRDGKRELAQASLRASGAAYLELVLLLLGDEGDLPESIEQSFASAADAVAQTGWANMCPVGTIAGEVADTEPLLRATLAEVMDDWLSAGTDLFARRGLDRKRARLLTLAMLTAIEGAFILARTLRSTEPVLAAGASVATYAERLLTERQREEGALSRASRGSSG